MSSERITITLKSDILHRIETSRGLIPRSRFIEDILEKSFSKKIEKQKTLQTSMNNLQSVHVKPNPGDGS